MKKKILGSGCGDDAKNGDDKIKDGNDEHILAAGTGAYKFNYGNGIYSILD